MSDEKEEIENEPFYKSKSFYESPYVVIGFVFFLLVILYYIVSPLQNCKRNWDNDAVCYNKKYTDISW